MPHITRIVTVCLLCLTGHPFQTFALSETDFEVFGRRYGVSPQLLHAISIVESCEGALTGTFSVTTVVDNIQLKFLRKVARSARRDMAEFIGSRAGAMGYMQIIPSTFYYYAQDGNGDGVKDPLNDYDSLATAAYFLAVRIATHQALRDALRDYNNSTAYTFRVLQLYVKLEVDAHFAGILKYFRPSI